MELVRKRYKVGALFAAAIATLCLGWGLFAVSSANADELQPGLVVQDGPEVLTVSLTAEYGQTDARSMLSMINAFRQGDDAWEWNEDDTEKVYHTNLQPLVYDYGLEQSAMLRAAEVALHFDHQRPNGEWYYTVPNYIPWGENIAAGMQTADAAFEAWQETDEPYARQGHRRNMLDPYYASVGIGHVRVNGIDYWTQEFGYWDYEVPETVANDSTQLVQVEVDPDMVTEKTLSVDPDEVTIFVEDSTPLPEVTATIGTEETWPEPTVSVYVDVANWVVGDKNIATVEGKYLVAQNLGATTLTADLGSLGKLALPVTVKLCEMYRLYNPHSGEHFYTSDDVEKNYLVDAGWQYEGVGWVAPTKGDPVYRLYNPYVGDHHYTMDKNEQEYLANNDWTDEGIGWYSAGEDGVPLYREYNPNAATGFHNYTTDINEDQFLVNEAGWQSEGIGWYGLSVDE